MAKKKKIDRGIRISGKDLRDQRKSQGYTIQTLADKHPPQDPKTVGKAERGGPIDPPALKMICDKLGISPITLLPNQLEPIKPPQGAAEKERFPCEIVAYGPKKLIDLLKQDKDAPRIFNALLDLGVIKDGVVEPFLKFSSIIFFGILTVADLMRLLKAHDSGRLKWLGITGVRGVVPSNDLIISTLRNLYESDDEDFFITALFDLTEAERAALFWSHKHSVASVAKLEGVTPAKIKKQFEGARNHLKKRMKDLRHEASMGGFKRA